MSVVALWRAMVFKAEGAERTDGSPISPWEGGREKKEIRVAHGLTFKGPRRGDSGTSKTSVNVDMDWEQVRGCELGGVLGAIPKRIIELRANFGVGARILTNKMDLKSAFKLVGVGMGGASRFEYRLGQFACVDCKYRSGLK